MKRAAETSLARFCLGRERRQVLTVEGEGGLIATAADIFQQPLDRSWIALAGLLGKAIVLQNYRPSRWLLGLPVVYTSASLQSYVGVAVLLPLLFPIATFLVYVLPPMFTSNLKVIWSQTVAELNLIVLPEPMIPILSELA